MNSNFGLIFNLILNYRVRVRGGPTCIQRCSAEYPSFLAKTFVYIMCANVCIKKNKKNDTILMYSGLSSILLPPKAQNSSTPPHHLKKKNSPPVHLTTLSEPLPSQSPPIYLPCLPSPEAGGANPRLAGSVGPMAALQ